MQASLNQMNSCNSGTKLSVFFSANFWRHTPSRKRGYDPEIGMNEKCAGMLHGKIQTQHMCRFQGIDGQLVGLEQSHGSSLEPLDKHFQSHGLVRETRKVSKLETKSATISTHDVLWIDLCDPRTHADCEKNLK